MPLRRHRIHGNPFTVRGPIARPVWREVYGREAPMALDVGFGVGAFLVELARRRPEWNVLGIEIRRHYVDGVLQQARAEGLTNLHAMIANANSHLDELVDDATLAFVSINFPDPWYKKRHHKRRVVHSDWVSQLLPKLQPGAEIHAMTDYEPVALQMREAFESRSELSNLDAPAGFAPESTTGIVTEFERRHVRRGNPIYRLRFRYARRLGFETDT